MPGDSITLSIIIPAFNEARRLPDTLQQWQQFLSSRPWAWELRVVDDGSRDDTAAVVESLSKREPRIVLQREPHRGKGGAVRAGMLRAKAGFRFLCDADLSMPPAELPRFLPPLAPAFDVAIGSREGAGARRVGEPWRRHATGRVFNWAIQLLAVPGISDTQCGFKMFTAAAAEAVLPTTAIEGWSFDVELLASARAQGWRIAEVPIEWHYGQASKLRVIPHSLQMLRDLYRIRAKVRRGGFARRPPAAGG